MKNKYQEVEVYPGSNNNDSFFVIREFDQKFKQTNQKLSFNKFILLFVIVCFIPLLLIFPLLTHGQSLDNENIITLINQERARYKLEPIKVNPKLNKAALEKGEDMLTNDYFNHFSPQGKLAWDFMLETGYNFVYAGENLAKDFSSAKSTVSAWMNSNSHRDNILNNKYKDTGLAVLKGKLGDKDTIIIVQIFATKAENSTSISLPSPIL